jgi:hypothetical protein
VIGKSTSDEITDPEPRLGFRQSAKAMATQPTSTDPHLPTGIGKMP